MRQIYIELAYLVMCLTADGALQGSSPSLIAGGAIWASAPGFESGENQLEFDVRVAVIALFV